MRGPILALRDQLIVHIDPDRIIHGARRAAPVALATLVFGCSANERVGKTESPDESTLLETQSGQEVARSLEARWPNHPSHDSSASFTATADRVAPGVSPPERTARPQIGYARRADGPFHLADRATGVGVEVSLRGAIGVPAEPGGGYLVYRNALPDADVLHRPSESGTEDYVLFKSRSPGRLEYLALLAQEVASVRLVENVLELLDGSGAPRLRMNAPFVIGADGASYPASVDVDGCAVDRDPRMPWGRAPLDPGGRRCAISIHWAPAIPEPIIVDPSWTRTGDMLEERQNSIGVVLSPDRVLVAGGLNYTLVELASAEIYDRASKTWAVTGSMLVGRYYGCGGILSTGRALVAGCGMPTGPCSQETETYDPATGTFTQVSGTSPTQLSMCSIQPLSSGRALIAGGYIPLLYDAAATPPLVSQQNSISPVGGVPVLVPSGPLAGKVLVVGDGTTHAATYDPAVGTASWTRVAPLTMVRSGRTGITLLPGGKVLVVGADAQAVPSAEVYDPSAGTLGSWTTIASPGSYDGNPLVRLGTGKVVKVQGLINFMHNTELFDPTSGTWSTLPPLSENRYSPAIGLLAGDLVLVAGGGTKGIKTAEILVTTGTKGGTCLLGSDCQSGLCVDGHCCDAACSGACDVCAKALGSSEDGLCMPAAGYVGSPSCAPYACSSASVSCPTTCASDANCTSALFCDTATVTCRPDLADGMVCSGDGQCVSGHCVDGVCCKNTCSTCNVCKSELKASGGPSGTCEPARDGLPAAACPKDPADSCDRDGTCNGGGKCRQFSQPGTSCGAGACDSNRAVGMLCDGNGSCIMNSVGVECAPAKCIASGNGGKCATTCASDDDCTPSAYCAGGICANRNGSGHACSMDASCMSGHCADGFCCDGACTGQCEACDVPGGEGTCAPVAGAPHGVRPACSDGSSGDSCAAATCDGVTRNSCARFLTAAKPCREAACSSGSATRAAVCNDMGQCPALASQPCAPFACAETQCKATCTSNADCTQGAVCITATGKCLSGDTCSDHTVSRLDGTTVDCSPFRCNANGTCRPACASVDDCAAPAVCNADGKCGEAQTATEANEGGCGCRIARERDRSRVIGWLIAAAALAIACRRRRCVEWR